MTEELIYTENERGNPTLHTFIPEGDRYQFDFNLCSGARGWTQFDTDQDAWYFGIWVHLKRQEILIYAEGDVTHTRCASPQSFTDELVALCRLFGRAPAVTTIDDAGRVTEFYQDRRNLIPAYDPQIHGDI